MTTRPPIGLVPRYIWIEQRISVIMRAIIRYEDAGVPVPPEWREELREHVAATVPR